MLPVKPRRILPTIFAVFAVLYMVRDPKGAAVAVTTGFHALMGFMDAMTTFFNGLG
ncbi:hypothetical protein GCM10009677_00980 [Sphaerisporangium rubeum]|uniref:Uncharacterized protein n=1 Tax=Sphaerisporangium rubeum TaxID=321317 RepID=A0A7X0M883_9ACTN|nr:hypothetical protein [Sphaerisporangium rubeum]MBB6475340.1 hypothetical protein [Sphaerisporangium rubeum]